MLFRHSYGITGEFRDTILFNGSNFIYPVGRHVALHNTENKMKFFPRKKGGRPISAMCLSPNGRYLVVCEYEHGNEAELYVAIYHIASMKNVRNVSISSQYGSIIYIYFNLF